MTNTYVKQLQLRWSDLDPNFHIKHSVYYDWGAACRLEFIGDHGLTIEVMQRDKMGVVLLREECVFRREIRLGDIVTITLHLTGAKRDYSRWSIRHEVFKNGETLSAIINVDGGCFDVVKRKIAVPGPDSVKAFEQMPKSEDFKWID